MNGDCIDTALRRQCERVAQAEYRHQVAPTDLPPPQPPSTQVSSPKKHLLHRSEIVYVEPPTAIRLRMS
jgi:hypothetical protein